MTSHDELMVFVRDGLTRGVPRAELETALVQAGWKAPDARSAVGRFADVAFPIPVPRPMVNHAARDAFLYLVLFSTLYTVAINFGGLLFELINVALPDPGFDPTAASVRGAIRWSVSALIAATPVFLFVASLIGREARRDPERRASKVRRWLTYVTLFIAAAVIIGDATILVYSLLGGELTTRFVLKSVVVAGIAGTVFAYYLSDVRAGDAEVAS